jgi:hypothetical protein
MGADERGLRRRECGMGDLIHEELSEEIIGTAFEFSLSVPIRAHPRLRTVVERLGIK